MTAVSLQDYEAIVAAQTWNGLHTMTVPTSNFPIAIQKIVFCKADPRYINNPFINITGASNTSDIQMSLLDNSATSGIFENAAAGTIPVFQFPGSTNYNGAARQLQLSFLRPGRFNLGFRMLDNSGTNYSIFELDCIVLP